MSGPRLDRGYLIEPFQFTMRLAGAAYTPTRILLEGGLLIGRAASRTEAPTKNWLVWPIEPRTSKRGPYRFATPFPCRLIRGRADAGALRLTFLRAGEAKLYEVDVRPPKSHASITGTVANLRRSQSFPPRDSRGKWLWNGWMTVDLAAFAPPSLNREFKAASMASGYDRLLFWEGALFNCVANGIGGPSDRLPPGPGYFGGAEARGPSSPSGRGRRSARTVVGPCSRVPPMIEARGRFTWPPSSRGL